jgi:3-methylcrotonyl-CoA carboxylase alpha subunit
MNVLGVPLAVDHGAALRKGPHAAAGLGAIVAPMPGKIIGVQVQEGASVTERQVLFVMESMKMQIDIPAPGSGRIVKLAAAAGQVVEAGYLLCELEENDA